ncbi:MULTISPECIES: PepSY domain-containing protein [unclassified Microbacterium]|uniref:PepSY domain-containing protein n=1 Tax=unclassified Microbacterium TaxID=2609290 RepID=UPI00301937E2
MDDKTPAPDQNPESAPDAPTVPVEPTPDAAAPDAVPTPAAPKPGRKRALLIGGGIAAAVVLAGGGVAVGAAIGDEFGDDDRPPMSGGPRHDGADDHGQRGDQGDHGDRGDRERDDDTSDARGPVTGIGTASADELIRIAEAARGVADGEVTSIDAKRDDTWEVELTTASGEETEVRVDKDLQASVIKTDTTDGDDTAPTLTLDDATIRALVAAALAEADGMITDLDVDGDDASPYDASVLTSDRRSIDIDFSADFAVVGTDTDR